MQQTVQFTKLNYADSQYPSLLKEGDRPPTALYIRGQLASVPLLGVVGTRNITLYGQEATTHIVRELAHAGIGIVSGLAFGVDAAAHSAALEAGGYTVAVLGSAIDGIYPARNRPLAQQILKAGGAIVSEYPPGTETQRFFFPERNRIIAGLSLGVLVIEADAKSGALITAQIARDTNRETMAVPGNVTSKRSEGTNNLIRSGAALVRNAQDVLDALELTSTQIVTRSSSEPANPHESLILQLIQTGITSSSQLVDASKLDAAVFARTLTMMEITGKIRPLGGGHWGLG
jgi:DNA processing protein